MTAPHTADRMTRIILISGALGAILGVLAYLLLFSETAYATAGKPPLGDLPAFVSLLLYAETQGIPVQTGTLDCQDGAWCVIGHTDYRIITVAGGITPEARVCVLAHELAHIQFHASETEAYYVGFRVCADLGYAPQADSQLTQLRERFPGRVSQDAVDFATQLSSVTEG